MKTKIIICVYLIICLIIIEANDNNSNNNINHLNNNINNFHTVASFSSMCHSQQLEFNGDAVKFNDVVFITQGSKMKRGSVFLSQPIPVDRGFRMSFSFRISHLDGHRDGDGFAFVLQSVSPNELGLGESGMGFAGLMNAIAIEFDTFRNKGIGDPDSHHIQLHVPRKRGGELNQFNGGHSVLDFRDHRNHSVIIEYVASHQLIKVELDERMILENKLKLEDVVILSDHTNAYVGFTASTGGAYEAIQILNWKIDIGARSFGCLEGFFGKNCEAGWSTIEEHQHVCSRYSTCMECNQQVNCCEWCGTISKQTCVAAHVTSSKHQCQINRHICAAVWMPDITISIILIVTISSIMTLLLVLCRHAIKRCMYLLFGPQSRHIKRYNDNVQNDEEQQYLLKE